MEIPKLISKRLNGIYNENHRMKKLTKDLNGSVLDIGFREGNPFLKKDKTVGIDINVISKPYRDIICASAEYLPFKGKSFDNIVAGDVIEHIHNPVMFLKECNRVLKTNGHLNISTDNPYRIQTLIANVFLVSGIANGVSPKGDHINYFIPRMLNALLVVS